MLVQLDSKQSLYKISGNPNVTLVRKTQVVFFVLEHPQSRDNKCNRFKTINN